MSRMLVDRPNLDNSNNWANVNNNGNVNNNNTNNNNGVAPDFYIGGYQYMQKGTNITNGDVSCSNNASDTIDTIFSFEHLYNSYIKCIKGVKWKHTVQVFMFDAWYKIAQIRKSIINCKYQMDPMHFFTVCERGKTRKISALSLKDRIVHKCLCDYYLTPLLSKSLIYDSGATIKNKGILFTKNRTITHLQKFYHKYGNKGYVLRIDFHNYFESIDHNILLEMLKKKINNEEIFNFVSFCIPKNIKGLGLGSQISQICAMYYVNEIDHLCKDKLRLKFYSRYMDDIYVISNSYIELQLVLNKIKMLANKLHLIFNDNKTKIYKLKNGFIFCKVRYILTDTGKILKLIASHSFRSMKNKIKKKINLDFIYPSWATYVYWFNAYKRFYLFNKKYIIPIKEKEYYEIFQKQKRQKSGMLTHQS